QKKPLLVFCLGMQMLFEYSNEFQKTAGLGLIPGYVDAIKCKLKTPHIGFNNLEIVEKTPLLNNISNEESVYFVHSFMAYTEKKYVSAYCDYEIKIPALVQNGNVFGAQFHPEKSGDVGLEILKNFRGLI
ncbi:MAG: imidazole glycerol phosphate synthase subunit HisH, partial [Oscillospiraceae bacterium]